MTSLSAGVAVVQPTELQNDNGSIGFQREYSDRTHKTSKTRKSFVIDCTTRFYKKSDVYFYRLPKATEKKRSK